MCVQNHRGGEGEVQLRSAQLSSFLSFLLWACNSSSSPFPSAIVLSAFRLGRRPYVRGGGMVTCLAVGGREDVCTYLLAGKRGHSYYGR